MLFIFPMAVTTMNKAGTNGGLVDPKTLSLIDQFLSLGTYLKHQLSRLNLPQVIYFSVFYQQMPLSILIFEKCLLLGLKI